MLSYVEWDRFLSSAEASAYLNELYVKYFTTLCPGCGAACQRDGGACNSVTCAVCKTNFVVKTNVSEVTLVGSPRRAADAAPVPQTHRPELGAPARQLQGKQGFASPRPVLGLSNEKLAFSPKERLVPG